MSPVRRNFIRGLTSLVVVACSWSVPAVVTAQQQEQTPGAVLQEVIVTATKREANLQNVPFSVSATSQIINSGAQDLGDYELGAKTQWLEKRVTFNLDVFYSDIKDLQATTTAGTCSSRVVFNVPTARSGWGNICTGCPNAANPYAARLDAFGGPLSTNSFTFNPELPSYTIGNLRFGLKTDHWQAAAYINNIWDETAHLALDYERGRTARLGYLTNQPRTLGVYGSYSF